MVVLEQPADPGMVGDSFTDAVENSKSKDGKAQWVVCITSSDGEIG